MTPFSELVGSDPSAATDDTASTGLPPTPITAQPLPPPPAPMTTNWLSVASLACALLVPGLGSILAIPLGLLAIQQIDASKGQQGSRAMAVWGVALGVVGIIATIIVTTVVLVAIAHHPNSSGGALGSTP